MTWALAQTEAEAAGSRELLSASKIYRARGTLGEGNADLTLNPDERRALALAAKNLTLAEMGSLKGSPLSTAFAWKVVGLAEKELANFPEAEKAILQAAAIHEKNRYLEDTAYDWYLIASVRSRAGNYAAARTAIQQAIAFDRRAENANGLGMDWQALGRIEEKAGNPEAAKAAYMLPS